MTNGSGFKYPLSCADEQKLQDFCAGLSHNPALFLRMTAAAFVQSLLNGNENPREKAKALRRAMWIKDGNASFLFSSGHPLVGNEFKQHMLDALSCFIDTGKFLSPE